MKTIFCISGYHFSKPKKDTDNTTHGLFCLSFSHDDITKIRHLQETKPCLFNSQWNSIYHDCFKNGYLKVDFNQVLDQIDHSILIDNGDSFAFFSTDIKQIHKFYEQALIRVYQMPLVCNFHKTHSQINKHYNKYSKLAIIK